MSQTKVSDYVIQFLAEKGIKDLFLISGGGMMHLLDAAQRNDNMNLIFNYNEQATGICAESYAQYTGEIGACMVTTGPGATNAFTGCAGAWVDSTPAFYISGQCKTEAMGQLKNLRIYGAQEIAIIPCVKPITKYAVTILNKNEIKYHLEKAYFLATNGRKGPVWIDIPLDIQGATIDTDELVTFDAKKEELVEEYVVHDYDIKKLYSLINGAKRPAILIGHGVVAAKMQSVIRQLVEEFKIPVLATWRAKGIFGDEEKLFMGSPGIPTTRFSNYVLQNSDFLLIIGTRLNPVITAYDEPHFGYNAKKVIVDIEEKEIEKLNINFEMKFVSDAKVFLQKMCEFQELYVQKDRNEWLEYCSKIKDKYLLSKEIQINDNEGKVNGYTFADKLSDYSKSSDIFIGSSSGRTCGISHMAYRLKLGQKFVTSMGLGAMGWCLPSAIACCIASGKKRTILFEGDGSLQHNIQELQLIQTYKLPLKLFIWSNDGYASIYAMQKNNFKGRLAGCDESSGLKVPSVEAVSVMYNLPYYRINNDSEIDGVLSNIMQTDEACICEVIGSINFDEIPKSMTVANEDGTFTSSKLEYLYPYVSDEEQKENMPGWK